MTVTVLIEVESTEISNEVFDFEVPINMPLSQLKNEVLESMQWSESVKWEMFFPDHRAFQDEDTLENLRCWDGTVIIFRAIDKKFDVIPQQAESPRFTHQIDGFHDIGAEHGR